jgi:hypothetical protein
VRGRLTECPSATETAKLEWELIISRVHISQAAMTYAKTEDEVGKVIQRDTCYISSDRVVMINAAVDRKLTGKLVPNLYEPKGRPRRSM